MCTRDGKRINIHIKYIYIYNKSIQVYTYKRSKEVKHT